MNHVIEQQHGHVSPSNRDYAVTFDLTKFRRERPRQTSRVIAALNLGYGVADSVEGECRALVRGLARLSGGHPTIRITPDFRDLTSNAPSISTNGLALFEPFDFDMPIEDRKNARIWIAEHGNFSDGSGDGMWFGALVMTVWHELKHLVADFSHLAEGQDIEHPDNIRWRDEMIALGKEFPSKGRDPLTGEMVQLFDPVWWQTSEPEV